MINKKGFTLVELLVVIAIIGILSTVVMANLNSAKVKARDTKRVSDLLQIKLALEMYADVNNNHYPAAETIDDLGSSLSSYLSTMPKDPISSQSYKYAYYPSTNPTFYHLGATLENSSSNLFSDDKDCNSTTGAGCPSANAYKNGFNGTNDSTNKIYDITN